MKKRLISVKIAVIFWLLGTALAAFAQEPFYKGKNIRMIVATSAGGGFDAYTRVIARHIGKHISGQPSISVENMPGAGHLIGA
ncbi:MAG: Bug family tripartite tricarboxylate transporter substrate binding protein, partial [Candidatus Binatia bacterium]